MKLYIVRHGEAVSKAVDPQRSLSPQGRRDVIKVAEHFQSLGVRLDLFYHSTKKRAQQTAQIMKDHINPTAKLIEKDYLAPDDPLDDFVNELSGLNQDLIVAGHLPFVEKLVSRLIADDQDISTLAFSTGSVAILEQDSSLDWHLEGMITPENC